MNLRLAPMVWIRTSQLSSRAQCSQFQKCIHKSFENLVVNHFFAIPVWSRPCFEIISNTKKGPVSAKPQSQKTGIYFLNRKSPIIKWLFTYILCPHAGPLCHCSDLSTVFFSTHILLGCMIYPFSIIVILHFLF